MKANSEKYIHTHTRTRAQTQANTYTRIRHYYHLEWNAWNS